MFLLLACTTPPEPAPPPRPAPPVEAPPPAAASVLGPAPTAELPDIVLVSIDTLRPDHLGAYGHQRPTSPFIDGLAAKGVRFAHARSPSPWTLPAHTTMMTGQLPTRHLVVEDNLRLSDHVPVLPDLLRGQGYATAGAVSTLFVSALYGFHRGFVHFNDFGIHDKKKNLGGTSDTKAAVDDLLAWTDRAPADRPWFLFLHTYDAHYAYDPPEPFSTMFDDDDTEMRYRSYAYFKKNPLTPAQMQHQVAQYDEAIRYIDAQLARMDAELRKRGREVRWVITSDHGEEFGERGSWGHGHTLYAEQLRVPLIMSGPGLPKGVVVEGTVGTQDLAPTLLAWGDAAGLQPHDGIDLNPHLDGTPVVERPFLAETSRHKTARLGLYENGRRLEWNVRDGKREVYADAREETVLPDEPALQTRAVELLGKPWTTVRAGKIAASRAKVLTRRVRSSQTLEAGTQFQVFPLDAPVVFEDERPMGATGVRRVRPPLRWEGGVSPVPVDLSQDTKDALEALGYVQE